MASRSLGRGGDHQEAKGVANEPMSLRSKERLETHTGRRGTTSSLPRPCSPPLVLAQARMASSVGESTGGRIQIRRRTSQRELPKVQEMKQKRLGFVGSNELLLARGCGDDDDARDDARARGCGDDDVDLDTGLQRR